MADHAEPKGRTQEGHAKGVGRNSRRLFFGKPNGAPCQSLHHREMPERGSGLDHPPVFFGASSRQSLMGVEKRPARAPAADAQPLGQCQSLEFRVNEGNALKILSRPMGSDQSRTVARRPTMAELTLDEPADIRLVGDQTLGA